MRERGKKRERVCVGVFVSLKESKSVFESVCVINRSRTLVLFSSFKKKENIFDTFYL